MFVLSLEYAEFYVRSSQARLQQWRAHCFLDVLAIERWNGIFRGGTNTPYYLMITDARRAAITRKYYNGVSAWDEGLCRQPVFRSDLGLITRLMD